MSKPSAPSLFVDFKRLTPEGQVLLATSLSVMVAGILVILKVLTLFASGSMSILASLTDSGLDLLASVVTFVVVRYAKTPPDKEHPFGHGKAEAFSALFQASLVFASSAIVMQSCLRHFQHPEPISRSGLAIGVLVVSILLTFGLVAFQNLALKNSQSVAVSADRMHYLTDIVTNVMALVGVAAAMAGFGFMDAVAGFLMSGWFIWGAVSVLREAADHLMDRGLDDDALNEIRELVQADGQILGLHQLRSRLAGPYIHIQMHVELDPALTLVEAHKVMIAAEARLTERFPHADIIMHPDPKGLAEPHSGALRGDDEDDDHSTGDKARSGFDSPGPIKA